MKLFVTGGAGFIGSNFVLYMLKQHPGYQIINVDALTYAGNLENLKSIESNPNHTFVKADITDVQKMNELIGQDVDAVVNFAAESHVDRSILEPDVFVKTNVLGTQVLLDAARKHNVTKFVQVSTDEVYGTLGETGYFIENTPLDPHSPYSSSKAGADLMVKAFFDTYKMPVNITRCSNNYGPYQFPEKLIPLLINNCLNHKCLPIYGDGMNIRDWLYVEDHCKAIDIIINSGTVGEIYNIGGHNERTNIQIVKTIINYLSEKVEKEITEELITYVEDRKGHDKRYAIDPTKIKDELGWYPETPFEVGIKNTIKWNLDNKDWINNITTGEYENYYNNMYENSK